MIYGAVRSRDTARLIKLRFSNFHLWRMIQSVTIIEMLPNDFIVALLL